MKIIIAKDAGYCFGVRDAVNSAYEMSKKYGEVYICLLYTSDAADE